MSKQLKELKDVNFSIRPVQANFASVGTVSRMLNIDPATLAVGSALPDVTAGTDQNLLRQRVAQINRTRSNLLTQLEGYKNLPTADADRVDQLRRAIAASDSRLRDLNNQRRALRIQNSPAAAAQLAGQRAEIQAKINQLIGLGVDRSKLTSIDAINHELSIRGLAPIGNFGKVSRAAAVAAKPVAPAATGNAFDRAVRKIGGAARRHPVMAVLGGLAAIGGAVRISKARDDGRIDPDSYYIMDNNSMSMVPRAFPSREAAMYIRDERYPGAAINKGTTLLGKA